MDGILDRGSLLVDRMADAMTVEDELALRTQFQQRLDDYRREKARADAMSDERRVNLSGTDLLPMDQVRAVAEELESTWRSNGASRMNPHEDDLKLTSVMKKASEKATAPTPTGDDFVRMYPCSRLNEQLRDPSDALSAFKVVKDAFFDRTRQRGTAGWRVEKANPPCPSCNEVSEQWWNYCAMCGWHIASGATPPSKTADAMSDVKVIDMSAADAMSDGPKRELLPGEAEADAWIDTLEQRADAMSDDSRVYFMCQSCEEHNPEIAVSPRSDIAVMPDGTWLCGGCYSDCDKSAYGMVASEGDFEFPHFRDLPRPAAYKLMP